MKRKSIFILAALAVLLFAGLGIGTYAWLTDTDSTTVSYTMGDVEYAVTLGTTATNPVVPGQPLLTGTEGALFTIANTSTVQTQLRVRFDLTAPTNGEGSAYSFGESATADEILVVLGSGWVLRTENSKTYLYYEPAAGTGSYIAANTSVVSPITSIMFNGALVGNAASTVQFTFTFTFESKQAEYVTWADMGSINFSTGLAA